MESVLTILSFGPEGWGDDIATGMMVTVSLALATLPFGLVAGYAIARGKLLGDPYLRAAADIYTTIFRGLPELLTLFLVYYGAGIAVRQVMRLAGADTAIEINAFVAGMIALGAVFSAYASEVFVSAFKAIPRGQYEGAYAIGLSHRRTMRLVIWPQLIRLALPGLSNLWMILLKDTALVSVIGLADILRQTSIAARVTREAFLFFLVACLLYLILALLSSIVLSAIERRVTIEGARQ
ncbi:ABC transporter permease [Chelativorans sp. SCAU2101]|jgi:amine acid ABC transporter, permease protein, 3-TM region, His/Glu/Gln/Arg/opine family|uniref:ABC transporter permease n=1 Tax=Chelativorans petroleitrophicus TaxID=2975484 RepID=A0A9X3B5V6_9HYPH|nr:ABC transporter permease [Chelativorans petroleitrophicus]MCT8989362.1 ABC transporter permease [Chelativorans petroleitrophicus]